MQNILKKSSISQETLPHVEVLLATFNSENYLEDFLKSLSTQQGVTIHLLVSDDGSTDKTLKILEEFRSQFFTLKILEGPHLGPAANFFNLLEQSNMQFVALADHDDVWQTCHLADSIQRIQKMPYDSLPLLSISKVSEFNEIAGTFSIWPNEKLEIKFPGILYENVGRGCTMVLNKALVDLINASKKEYAIMHDWWILLLAWLYGEIVFTQESEVNYRIHPGNVVGNPNLTLVSIIKRAIISKMGRPRHLQIASLHAQYSAKYSYLERYSHLDVWLKKIHSPWFVKLPIFFEKQRLRSNKFQDFLLKISIVLLRCKPTGTKCKLVKYD